MKISNLVGSLLFGLFGLASSAQAVQIDFTGGTVQLLGGGTVTTNNSVNYQNIDYYDEDGFRLDFLPNSGSTGFATNIGNYYGVGNDVIHSHWSTGDYGDVTQIRVTKLDGAAFDLNYFVLTSNTDTGGAPASGNERAFIHASIDGVTSSYSQLLPSENWGFPANQIFLGSQFDNIKAFWFSVENAVDCFGMDNFFINEDAPPNPNAVPLPGTLGLFLLGLVGLVGFSRKGKALKV